MTAGGSYSSCSAGRSLMERPADRRASRRAYSICALTLRRSSDAHRASAAYTSGSSRSSSFFRSTMGSVEGSGVDDGLGGPVATEDDQQVGHHLRLALLVEFDHVLLTQAGQG